MSTPNVTRDTLALAKEKGLRVALLPQWYDVDTRDELERLERELPRSANGSGRHTRDFLKL